MILSSNQELGEYDLIREADHIAKVWSVIEASLPQYWDRFVENVVPSDAFESAIHDYEKEAAKYRRFFDLEALEEYYDDPNAFKQVLSRDVPILAQPCVVAAPSSRIGKGTSAQHAPRTCSQSSRASLTSSTSGVSRTPSISTSSKRSSQSPPALDSILSTVTRRCLSQA